MSTPAPQPDLSHVAMLSMGDEVYGVGTVIKRYAENSSGIHHVCLMKGPMYDWLREGGHRVTLVEGLARFIAGKSLTTLARLPFAFSRAKRDADRIHDVIKDDGIRVVHAHWLPQQIMAGYLRKRGYRAVWQIHNNMNTRRLFGAGQKLNHRLARWGADLMLPVSDFIADFWRGADVPIRVVRNCAPQLYRQSNTLSAPPIKCVIAGRLVHSKGHHTAVEAVIQARQAGRDVHLDLFGGPLEDNPYADDLRAKVRAAGMEEAVHFRGFCTDLRERHQSYHLGLQCRVDPEPCSVWVCETLVDGLPLLASATGGTPELVAEGETGYLFRSDDSDDLAAKLIDLTGDLPRLEAMRAAAFQRGQTHITVERFIRESVEAYDAVAPSSI